MPRYINRDNLLQPKVPRELWDDERSHKSSASSINMDGAINLFLDQQVIDGLDVLVLSGIRCADDGADLDNSSCQQVFALQAFAFPLALIGISTDQRLLTPMVFSSTRFTASSGSITYRSLVQ